MDRRIIHTACGILVVGVLGLCLSQVIADTPPVAPPTSAPTTAAVAINWDEAAKHVGETVTVTGPVMGTHATTGGKALVLNVGKDYPDNARFTVMINTDKDHPASADTYKGKTVSVTGKVELYHKVPEIKVKSPDAVTIQ